MLRFLAPTVLALSLPAATVSGSEPSPRELLRAKQHLESRQAAQSAGITGWEWLGPGNIGGRIRTILTDPNDPNTILVGSVVGGIWRSTDAGATWSPINDFLPLGHRVLRDAGHYHVTWRGEDDFGRNVSSGVYFYRLDAGDFHRVRKMVLLK